MKLNISPLSQRDVRWKDKKLGGGSSIGLYGCLLVCHSMALNYFGHEQTPDLLNEIFKSQGCFDGNNLNFYKIGDVYGDYKAVEYYECNDIPCDLSKIDNQLAKNMPVIAKVDFDMNPATKGDWHFVLIIGKDEQGKYFINDPWYGETYYFDAKYGDPAKGIYGLRIYEGVPSNTQNLEDKVSELQAKVKSLDEALAEKSLELNTIRGQLEQQERDNKDLGDQLNQARSQRDSANWEKEQVEIKNKSLNEQIEAQNKEIDRLKSERNLDKYTNVELIKTILSRMFGKGGG